ncbi:hypothetical protein Q5P01_025191 [Channa striata]|uniref:Uncharacterized protein n=1 Tax=Channa striata TaxID=64152 RepID=A0AA88ILX7_CHASR|nr:hypothetical protein Q5P01_025191 [Channa striata]
MRLLLAIALILLFLWFYKAHMSGDNLHGYPCEAVFMSKAAVSLFLSPLSLYSWLSSTLLRLILSAPALVLTSLYRSLLLLLAWPCCIAIICISALLTCLHVAVYLLHLALGVGVLAILILTRHKMADTDSASGKVTYQQKKLENRQTKTRLLTSGRRAVH